MKRMTYVDKNGNQVNVELERKKPLLRFFLIIGNVLPVIIIGILIYAVIQNKICINIYDMIKKSSKLYLEDQGELPRIEGENSIVNIGDLYSEEYLRSSSTDNTLCSGTVKVTKYKKDYIYTLDVKNCNKCSVNKKYGGWSELINNYPSNKAIVDVIPLYNFYDREVNVTAWSEYYENSELDDEVSDYGINLPMDTSKIPEIPKEGKVVNIENDTTYYYRYRDRAWKWYDIEGQYSQFSSERPDGFANKDEDSERITEWSEYSLDYPEEKSYREINQTTGYKFYYVNKKGEKIYYNSKKYTPEEEIDSEKYDQRDEDSTTLYRYQDKQWRWYNGQKRRYSPLSPTQPEGYLLKDSETETLGSESSWSPERPTDADTNEYRVEERKLMTRFRTRYEILSDLVLKDALTKEKFEKETNSSILEFSSKEDKKLETTYKFKYRKS